MNKIRDGDLYKRIEIEDVKFEIRYGYVSEGERERGWEPHPIYPDFTKESRYTKDGEPFVTAFQDVCEHYKPTEKGEEWCNNCEWLDKRDTHIGICKCPLNRLRQNE